MKKISYTTSYRQLLAILRRSYRNMFHKDWNVINKGIEFFTDFSNIYGNGINNTKDAENFFADFMRETKGQVIIDFLDTDNWDCIKDVKFDHEKGLVYLLFRLPLADPIEKSMRRMAIPLDIYGIILKFNNIRFICDKNKKCFAIVINGYTLKDKEIKRLITSDGYNELKRDNASSFFSTDFIREKEGLTESMRVMKTPITSFWFIPKTLPFHPQDSEKYLYLYNLDKLEDRLKQSMTKLSEELKKQSDKEDEDDTIKMFGNKMRRVAEGLFKLIMCFYQTKYNFSPQDYNDRLLGEAIGPLKNKVYTSEDDKTRIGTIARVANDLSHDTGNSVTIMDIGELYIWLSHYISDFRCKIHNKGNELLKLKKQKPSPSFFFQKELFKWNFTDEIQKNIISKSDNCAFKITIKDLFSEHNWLSVEDNYLCKDGMIRKLPDSNNSDVLIVMSRDGTIALIESIYKTLMDKCVAEGMDEKRVYTVLEITAHYMRRDKPIHLFTLDEIKSLMLLADDSVNNKLVIDENGYAKIISNPSLGRLYPVSQETWCAGNNYVGEHSNLSDAKPSYHLCLKGWLSYLETGESYYADYYPYIEDEKSIIEKIKKYY